MDPVTAVGLAASCVSLVSKVVSTAKELHGIVAQLRGANKTIGHLATQVDFMEVVVRKLQSWLSGQPDIEKEDRDKFHSAINSCDVIISDILDHVQRILPRQGEDVSSLLQKAHLLWNDQQIKEQQGMLSTNLQLFQTFLLATQMSGRGKGQLGTMIEAAGAQPLIDKSVEDAKTIRTAKDAESHLGTAIVDTGHNLDIDLAVDNELMGSEAYRRAIRSTVRLQQQQERTSERIATVPEEKAPEPSASRTTGSTAVATTIATISTPTTPTEEKSRTNRRSLLSKLSTGLSRNNPTANTYTKPTESDGGEVSLSSRLKATRLEPSSTTQSTSARDSVEKTKHASILAGLAWKVSAKSKSQVETLCLQVEKGEMNWVKRTLSEGAFINGHSSRGCTPLATAIRNHRIDIAKYLLENVADVKLGYRKDWCASESHTSVSLPSVYPPMHLVVRTNCCEEILRHLIDHGAEVDDTGCVDFAGRRVTPLYRASVESAELLLQFGAKIEHKTTGDWNPLLSAIERNDVSTMRLLCSKGAQVEFEARSTTSVWIDTWKRYRTIHKDWPKPVTPLMLVAWCVAKAQGSEADGAADMIQLLAASGANVNREQYFLGKKAFNLDECAKDIPSGTALEHLCWASSDGSSIRLVEWPRVTTTTIQAIQAFIAARSRMKGAADALAYHHLPTSDFSLRIKALEILVREAGYFSVELGHSDYISLFCSKKAVTEEYDFSDGFKQLVAITVLLIKTGLLKMQHIWKGADYAQKRVDDFFGDASVWAPLCPIRWQAVGVLLWWVTDTPRDIPIQFHLEQHKQVLWENVQERRLFDRYHTALGDYRWVIDH